MGQKSSTRSDCGVTAEYNYISMEIGDDDLSSNPNGSSTTLASGIHSDDVPEVRELEPLRDATKDWQRKWTLLLYASTSILLFADQNLLAPNLTQVAEEFGFDDNERDRKLGGDIALAFFVLGAPASFVVGCCADSNAISRSFLFGIIVLIGEGACFLTYFTTTYTGLYITRALTGFSVGGALPLLSSVLGDWYKPEERSAVMASVGIGTGCGIAFGQGISGMVGPEYGWRMPFLIVSIPALLVAVLIMTTVVDPIRGGSELEDVRNMNRTATGSAAEADNTFGEISSHNTFSSNHASNQNAEVITPITQLPLEIKSYGSEDTGRNNSDDTENSTAQEDLPERKPCASCFSLLKPSSYSEHFETTKELLTSKTVLLTLIQGAPGCIPWGIVNTFLNDYLSEDCGMSVQGATTIILFFGIGNFFGIVLGGMGGDYLYKKDSRYPSLLSGSMAIAGCFPLWIMINTTSFGDDAVSGWVMIRVGLIAVLAGVGSGVTGPIVKSTLQNVTLPNARGQAFALLNTFDDFGRGLGPVFVAIMIINLGGRQIAFNVGVGGWVLCGIFNLCIFFTVTSDEKKTRDAFYERYAAVTQVSTSSSE